MVRLAVLGPVRAGRDETEVDLGQRQLRHVIGLLCLRAGRTVAPETVAEMLWGENPPQRAGDIVHRHIGTLRRLFEPGLPARQQGRWLLRANGGYRLAVGAESLDLLEFRRLAECARRASESGDTARALALRLDALRLWRGRCGADLDPGADLAAEFLAVDQERVALACTAVDEAPVPELLPVLQEIAHQEPLDEAVQARLMLLLATAGRQAAALSTFHAARSRLADELGVDPGQELRAAYDRVLAQETAAPSARPVPSQLPPGNRFFTGRSAELARLSGLLAEVGRDPSATVIGVVDGLPGVGKTSLVVQWAHQSAADFPDGRLYVDLRGFDGRNRQMDSDEAVSHLLSGLGVPHSRIPADVLERFALFRALTAARRLLIVLDNARDEEHVRPLLTASPGSLVLVTSRCRLSGLLAHEGATPVSLSVPSTGEAVAVLRDRLGPARVDGHEDVLTEIVERCGRLPLALAVVSARAQLYPEWSLESIATELRAAAPLDFLEGDEPRSNVRDVFSWSYRKLGDEAARLLRLLPVHPCPDFGVGAVSRLAAAPAPGVRQRLRELTSTRLLTEVRPGRFAFHDLIRAYALELGEREDTPQDRAEALGRLIEYLVSEAVAANAKLDGLIPDAEAATAWFTAELTVLEEAVAIPRFATWRLAELLVPYYERRAMFQRWASTAERGLHAAILAGDLEGQAAMREMAARLNGEDPVPPRDPLRVRAGVRRAASRR